MDLILGSLMSLPSQGVATLGIMDNAVTEALFAAQATLGMVTNNIHGPTNGSAMSDPVAFPRMNRFIASLGYLASSAVEILAFFKWKRCILVSAKNFSYNVEFE